MSYLEDLKQKKKLKNKGKESIIIAPTDYKSNTKISLLNEMDFIIESLLKNNYKVVLRPHPANRDDPKFLLYRKKYEKNINFIYDNSSEYFENYIKSSLLITDISGTAYTYSYLTLKPVLFFELSTNKKYMKKFFDLDLNYFKNRKKIGMILQNKNNLIPAIRKLIVDKKKKSNIVKLKKDILSKNEVIKRFDKIFNTLA